MPNEFSRGREENLQAQSESPEAAANQALLEALMRQIMMTGTQVPSLEASNIGQIRKMTIPPAWEKGPDYNNREHAGSYKEFHPYGKTDCQLGFYYRGRRTSETAGQNFKEVLEQESHELTPTEYSSLEETLRDKARAEDFTVKNARTEEINGKRVLIVEGRYNKNQNDSTHMFIDTDGTGTAVQEVFFQAPKEQYAKYAGAAKTAMESIRWR